MNKPCIAHCLEYPLALRGGVSMLVKTLLPELREGYRLVLVSPDTPESLASLPEARLLAGHFRWNPAEISRKASKRLARELADAGVALAHFHFGGNYGWGSRFPSRCPIPFAAGLGMACCSTVHGVVSPLEGYCGPQKPSWFKLALFPFAWLSKMRVLARLRAEIAVSRHDLEKLRRWYRPQRGKFQQVYHSRLRGPPPPNPRRELTILNVGHVAARKGQLDLSGAFALVAEKFPEWKLRLVGDFAEEHIAAKIRNLAKMHRLENRIELPGGRNDTADLMSQAAIYVQPSREEALGLALQEAMFAGCASIGTNVGGIPELIEHQVTGILVEPGNPQMLARALEELMSNAQLRETYGRRGAESIIQKGMTVEAMAAHHRELYDKILGGS